MVTPIDTPSRSGPQVHWRRLQVLHLASLLVTSPCPRVHSSNERISLLYQVYFSVLCIMQYDDSSCRALRYVWCEKWSTKP